MNTTREAATPPDATSQLGREISRSEFLGLTSEDELYIEIRLALQRKLKQKRTTRGLTQQSLAKTIGSSQSRIAKAEAGETSISLDLLLRALLATGATPREIGEAISEAAPDAEVTAWRP